MSKLAIHSTAVVSPRAEIAGDVEIGPYVVVKDNVKLGPRVKILANAYVGSWTEIGEDSEIHMGAVVGHLPQDLSFKKKKSYLIIGKRNIIREYATIHRGTQEESSTVIGNDNFIMCFAHVAHDCKLGNNIVIANTSALSGYVEVENKVFISAYVGVHQFARIGALSIIAAKSRIIKDIPPYMLAKGESTVCGINVVGMRRAGFSQEIRSKINRAHKILYRSGYKLSRAIEELEKACLGKEVRHLIDFLKKKSKRGLCAYAKKYS
ncbi:MAG: acyl-ACP--UDP-N-acetylglucosamine O-acyltransferase [Candidatus Omnitrophota bacterium]|nr:acyl-ACP--UDP-N-acetylglucosamine O-acyltransferase [Candidatus Omnitrophota bacterium]